MPEERRFVMPGVLERVPEACDFVVEAAQDAGLDERSVYHCQMAVDEWCTNIIEHGFGGYSEHGLIEIICKAKLDTFVVIIRDDGPPFDPTDLPEPDPMQPLEDRQPGGLGWFFIRKVMDEVRYERKDERNALTMLKKGIPLRKPAAEPASPYPAHTLSGDVRVLVPSGRLDSVNGPKFESALLAQVEAGYVRLIVDFQHVNYISSTGLKALLTTLRRIQERDGGMALAAMSARVREVFELSGFDTLFPIMPSVEDAVKSV